ncbi:MAG: BON domain-containing protein [Stenotrophomonas sp.]
MSSYHCDGSIADEVYQALSALPGATRIAVSVHDGRVLLRGEVAHPAQRSAIKDAVADIDGVSAITDMIRIQPELAPSLAAPVAASTGTGRRGQPLRR